MIKNEIIDAVKDLRELTRMRDELNDAIAAAQDVIKNEMTATNNYIIVGCDFKVTWQEIESTRIDSTALKKELPDIAARYSKTSIARRFCLS